jgi:hypothetical protein
MAGIFWLLLLYHGRCHCCNIIWKLTTAVAVTDVCWIRKCEVEEVELLLNESWKRESGTVVVSCGESHAAVTAEESWKSV